jgi:hypothetical protein
MGRAAHWGLYRDRHVQQGFKEGQVLLQAHAHMRIAHLRSMSGCIASNCNTRLHRPSKHKRTLPGAVPLR